MKVDARTRAEARAVIEAAEVHLRNDDVEIARLTRERDAAREAFARMSAAKDRGDTAIQEISSERDAAIAQLAAEREAGRREGLDGYALVPIEPTHAMKRAAVWALDRWREKQGDVYAKASDKHAIRWAAMLAAAPKLSTIFNTSWQSIETALRDGTPIIVASNEAPFRCHIAYWNAEGTSWVDDFGSKDGPACDLSVTGTWICGIGWFQPNEVALWMPLPSLPFAARTLRDTPAAPETGKTEGGETDGPS